MVGWISLVRHETSITRPFLRLWEQPAPVALVSRRSSSTSTSARGASIATRGGKRALGERRAPTAREEARSGANRGGGGSQCCGRGAAALRCLCDGKGRAVSHSAMTQGERRGEGGGHGAREWKRPLQRDTVGIARRVPQQAMARTARPFPRTAALCSRRSRRRLRPQRATALPGARRGSPRTA